MAQRGKAGASESEDLCSVPRTHTIERDNWFSQVVLLTSTCALWLVYVHAHTLNKCENNKILKYQLETIF